MLARAIVVLFALVAASAAIDSKSKVESFSPSWGHGSGGESVTVTGCHFRSYGDVICRFGEWDSPYSHIVSDTQVVCTTPPFASLEIKQLPITVDVQLIFGGLLTHTEVVGKFIVGPTITAINPTRGKVQGGGLITITGRGFKDDGITNWNTPTVWFDGRSAAGTVVSDTAITATIPVGDFNLQNMINIQFGMNQYTAHSDFTYTYGPVVTQAPCALPPNGSAVITINGHFFTSFSSVQVSFTRGATEMSVAGTVVDDDHISVTVPGINTVTFNAATLAVYGTSKLQFAYFEASSLGQVKGPGRDTFFASKFGPTVTSVTPTQVHLGGDLLTVNGCGFSFFQPADINVKIAGTVWCNGPSLTVVSDTQITCATNNSQNCAATAAVTAEFRYLGSFIADPLSTNVKWGPGATSVVPARGKISGGDLITITGFNFDRTSAAAPFASYTCVFKTVIPGFPVRTVATRVSDTVITCLTPNATLATTPASQTSDVSIEFNGQLQNNVTSCDLSTTKSFTFFPLCTSVNPTYGIIAGGTAASIVGAAWENHPYLSVKFTNPDAYATNVKFVAVDSLTFTTPVTPFFAERGGNRLFGSLSTVSVEFNGGGNGTASVSCGGSYRWGPIVTSINPIKGPIGPVGFAGTSVTVSGGGFAPYAGKSGMITFGDVIGTAPVTTAGDIQGKTTWASPYYAGERASVPARSPSKTDRDVVVFFDTCNTTWGTQSVSWGPAITSVTRTPPGHLYGFHPNGNQEFTVTGTGFAEFADVGCFSGGIALLSTKDSDTVIRCKSAAHPFYTNATIRVAFGKGCDQTLDYSRSLYAGEIFYFPRITDVVPDVGLLGGGQSIAISGQGFASYNSSTLVFVGDYSAVITGTFGTLDNSVTVTTPKAGAVKTETRAFLGEAAQISFALEGDRDWRVWLDKFTYGPVCKTLSLTRGKTAGGDTVTITGTNFNDPDGFDPANLYVVFDDSKNASKTLTGGDLSFATPPSTCGHVANIKVYLGQPNVFIQCPSFTYGATFDTATLKATCSGGSAVFTNQPVTIDGSLYDDFVQADVAVTVGGTTAPVTGFTASQITFTAPNKPFGTAAQSVVLTLSKNATFNCPAMTLGNLFYRPTWTSASITAGAIAGTNTLAVSGSGFSCFTFTNFTVVFGAIGAGSSVTTSPDTGYSITVPAADGARDVDLSLLFNNTISLTTTSTGATLHYHYGPIVTSLTPNNGFLAGDTITVAGTDLDDAFYNQTLISCVFDGTTVVTPITKTATAVTCYSPTWKKCGDFTNVQLRYTKSGNPTTFTAPAVALKFSYGPTITSVDVTRTTTTGGNNIVFTGTNFAEFSKARCLFGSRISAVDVSIISNTTITCALPEAPFGYTGMVGILFDPHYDAATTLTNGWHWHPYISSLSAASVDSNAQSTWLAEGAGFCPYNTVKVSLAAGAEAVQSDVFSHYEVSTQAGLASAGAVTPTATFCDDSQVCSCAYKGTPDSVSSPASINFL